MLAFRRDMLLGALFVLPLLPIAWFLGQSSGTSEQGHAVDCACSSRCDELIRTINKATSFLTDAALPHSEVAGSPAASTQGQFPLPVRESDLETRTAIKEELNRSFSVLWRTTIDDSYGVRNALLRSGRSPFDPGVDAAISAVWQQLSAADSQMARDEEAIKARFPLYFQNPTGSVPDGQKQEWQQQFQDYARVHNERDADYMKERGRIIQTLRDSISKK
jgi:hypothetical protein